jgi:hypothetical protein
MPPELDPVDEANRQITKAIITGAFLPERTVRRNLVRAIKQYRKALTARQAHDPTPATQALISQIDSAFAEQRAERRAIWRQRFSWLLRPRQQ